MKTVLRTMLRTALVTLSLGMLFSCSFRDELTDLDGRVSKLETLCAQLQTNLNAASALLEATSNAEVITGITPILQGSQVIGYTISLSKSGSLTLYNGQPGETPTIAVKMDTDGCYYWTVNDNWVTDNQGNKMPVKGVTPRLKIDGGEWFVSMDEGKHWEKLGWASGNPIIQNVEESVNQVVFTLD